MAEPNEHIESILKGLESVQAHIGQVQIALIEILTDETSDEWDDAAQAALIKLEGDQRNIGQVQIALLRQLYGPRRSAEATAISDAEVQAPDESVAASALVPLVWTDPQAWLKARGIRVRRVRGESGMDAEADRLAVFLAERLEMLSGFYDAVKRRASGRPDKWYSVKDKPPATISAVLQFGSMLHSSGLLSEFKYIRRDRAVLFNPTNDGRVAGFFTGGWMERYALHLARQAVQGSLGVWSDERALVGASVTLPDGAETEFDILVGLDADRVLWLECKTGDWQSHVERFKAFNERYLRVPTTDAALVLLNRLTSEEKACASELTAMTVLHLDELRDWLANALRATECSQG